MLLKFTFAKVKNIKNFIFAKVNFCIFAAKKY